MEGTCPSLRRQWPSNWHTSALPSRRLALEVLRPVQWGQRDGQQSWCEPKLAVCNPVCPKQRGFHDRSWAYDAISGEQLGGTTTGTTTGGDTQDGIIVREHVGKFNDVSPWGSSGPHSRAASGRRNNEWVWEDPLETGSLGLALPVGGSSYGTGSSYSNRWMRYATLDHNA